MIRDVHFCSEDFPEVGERCGCGYSWDYDYDNFANNMTFRLSIANPCPFCRKFHWKLIPDFMIEEALRRVANGN